MVNNDKVGSSWFVDSEKHEKPGWRLVIINFKFRISETILIMWSSHDSEFEIIQSVLDVESMMAQGATKTRYWRKVYATNSREKMERKWEHQILFSLIQILEYPQGRVYQLKIQEIHLSLFFESLVTRQDWRIRRRRIGRPGWNICRPNQPGIIKIIYSNV